MNNHFTILVSVCFLVLSCRHESEIPDVEPKLAKYVQRFFDEGNRRGLNINLENTGITVRFSRLVGKNGTCFTARRIIEIDSVLWQERSEYDKEWLIYHELGHCILKRDHLLESLSRGECKSIMSNSEGLNCSINFKSNSWRQYYLDELFDNRTKIGVWYIDTSISHLDTITLVKGKERNFKQDSFSLNIETIDTSKNFVLDVSFTNPIGRSRQICLQFDDKIFQLKTIEALNFTEILNLNKYFFAGRSNLNTNIAIRLKIIKKGFFYIFMVDNNVIHVMDFDLIKEKVLKINCFSTENDFNFMVYYFK